MWTYKNVTLTEGFNGFYLNFGSESHGIGDGVDTFIFDENGYPNAQEYLEELVNSSEVWIYFKDYLQEFEDGIASLRVDMDEIPYIGDNQYTKRYNDILSEIGSNIDKLESLINDFSEGR